MNATLSAAYIALEEARWGSTDDQLHAANELLLALKQAKLDEACDESGCVSKSLPLIKPLDVVLADAPGRN